MKNQLTLGNILALIKELKNSGMTIEEICKLPVYIGDDDELNGVHTGWYAQLIGTSDKDTRALIKENPSNIPLGKNDLAILIS